MVAGLVVTGAAFAGYEAPSFIDGCRSQDGRFEIAAKPTLVGKSSHGPNAWNFLWKDLRAGVTNEFPAQGLQGGQIRGQLFIAPDGETFAHWNHITMWWPEKSHMHASSHRDVVKKDQPGFAEQFIFKHRLIVYRKDGSIVRALDLDDLLTEEEFRWVLPVFNRVEWMRPYKGLNHKAVKRPAYTFTKVSLDYTVLEFQVGDPKAPRPVRVSLTDGTLLDAAVPLPEAKTPVLLADAEHHPSNAPDWVESYIPSLDPVREPGHYRIDPIEVAFAADKAPRKQEPLELGEVRLLATGFSKADTPSWRRSWGKKPEEAGHLVFTDLDVGTLYRLSPDNEALPVWTNATRGRLVANRTFVGLIDGAIARADFNGKPPEVLLSEGVDGRSVSLNDMVVSQRGLVYFTTLKDPEKGRLTLLDPETGAATVLFDGEDVPHLANPNGIALSKSQRFLYVGISNYGNRKHSGVYAFPILGDGRIDLAAGRDAPRLPVKGPDGIAVDRQDNTYVTAGGEVRIFDRYARPLGRIRIPKGSGTNLCFGGPDRFRRTLFITTRESVYAVETPHGAP